MILRLLTLLSLFTGFIALPAQAAETRNITFPVIGDVSYSDDFGAPRVGHTHEGNDLLGHKLMPLVAAVDGEVRYVAYPEPDYGYYVTITDADGYKYNYLHINNDNPGTDDGLGGGRNAYAPYMKSGNKVVAGQLIGWMGDSGNAESTTPHLHFEIRQPDNTAIDPYESLRAAPHISTAVTPGSIGDEILPYGEFTGGASLALGNLDADTALELVTGAGPGGGPNVRVLNQSGSSVYSWFAYDETFHGGIDVAVGDVDANGTNEIVTGMGAGSTPLVKIFSANGTLLYSWLAYDNNFTGGVQVAVADLDGDGKAEIITGPGAGGGPQVKVFTQRGRLLNAWFAYDEKFHGGIDVAAEPASTTAGTIHKGRIVTGAGTGGGPQVRVFGPSGKVRASFFAYDLAFHGGVQVSIANDAITTVPASSGGPNFKLFDLTGNLVATSSAFEDWWTGGYTVAQADNTWWISSGTGGRRTSVQPVSFFTSHYR